MPTLETVAERHARRQKTLAQRTAQHLAQLWRSADPGSLTTSWGQLLPDVIAALSTSQATAAASAGVYIDDALEAQGTYAESRGVVLSSRFAGVASDGRALTSLLYQPVVSSLVEIKAGGTIARAQAAGLLTLDKITRTQIADAGRAAEAVALTARPKVAGYIRMLSQPSCSRCIILAGKWFKWNQGFKRHPRCDCRHIPAGESLQEARTDPKRAFEEMGPAEQDRVFTKAGAEAIRNGADINQVVNARRGMDTAVVFGRKVQHTREGITRYGQAGRKLGKSPVRLMPEQILIEAKGNRQEAIRLLRLHGYIR